MLIAGIFQTVALLLGLSLLAVMLLRRSFRYYGHRKPGRIEPPIVRTSRPIDDAREPLADAPPEMARWQVEMHQVARDVKGELDTKMRMLLELICRARLERERLETALERAERAGEEPDRTLPDKLARAADSAQRTADRTGVDDLPPMPGESRGA